MEGQKLFFRIIGNSNVGIHPRLGIEAFVLNDEDNQIGPPILLDELLLLSRLPLKHNWPKPIGSGITKGYVEIFDERKEFNLKYYIYNTFTKSR